MRINEAAEKAGVTPKNIRFYEAEGLLTPAREMGNRYRDYSEEDVALLVRIRLLRTVDVPLAEIRAVLNGGQSLHSCLERHMTLLRGRMESLEAASQLCLALTESGETLETLDAEHYLELLAQQQRKGAQFVDVKKKDNKTRKYAGAVLGGSLFAAIMVFLLGTELWAFATDPAGAPPMPIFLMLVGIPVLVIIGVLAALYMRIKEIKGGEEDAYRNY